MAVPRFNLQAAVERLKRHRDAWQELCRELRRTVVQHEHELKERWLRPMIWQRFNDRIRWNLYSKMAFRILSYNSHLQGGRIGPLLERI